MCRSFFTDVLGDLKHDCHRNDMMSTAKTVVAARLIAIAALSGAASNASIGDVAGVDFNPCNQEQQNSDDAEDIVSRHGYSDHPTNGAASYRPRSRSTTVDVFLPNDFRFEAGARCIPQIVRRTLSPSRWRSRTA